MNCIKRKCAYCGKDIVVEKINDSHNILYDRRYYHKDCFTTLCSNKTTKKWKMAMQNIDSYVAEANDTLSKILLNRKVDISAIDIYTNNAQYAIQKIFGESDVNQFIIEQYGINSIGNIYPRCLAKVYNGMYKHSMGVKIPPEHLLDMWQRKIGKLNNIRAKNIAAGKDMSTENRIAYDLAVIVSEYNSYLEWLEKQSVLESTPIQATNMIPVMATIKKVNTPDKEYEDIDELLYEIFD